LLGAPTFKRPKAMTVRADDIALGGLGKDSSDPGSANQEH
jgi:hypothetical protein